MKIATVFSGIGTPEMAAKGAYEKIDIVFACEIDKFARKSYKAIHNIDDDIFFDDITKFDAKKYHGQVDILVGGSPCQSFSIAGLRKGTDDERGRLIYDYVRVINECRPGVFIFENVKNFKSIDGGQAFKEFQRALRDIGYHLHTGILNTKDYGVPQNRERLFVVGSRQNLDFAFARPQKATTIEALLGKGCKIRRWVNLKKRSGFV